MHATEQCDNHCTLIGFTTTVIPLHLNYTTTLQLIVTYSLQLIYRTTIVVQQSTNHCRLTVLLTLTDNVICSIRRAQSKSRHRYINHLMTRKLYNAA